VGLILHKRLGDTVAIDEILVEILANDPTRLAAAMSIVEAALTIQPETSGFVPPPVILDIIRD